MGKKRKSYFNNNNNKTGQDRAKKFKFSDKVKLAANMKGFLMTYNCKFTFCINEAKKLLEQFSIEEDKGNQQEAKSSDVEKMLKEELEGLNKRDKEFHVLDPNAKYTLFIPVESSDPNQIAQSIFEHIETTKKPLGRFVQRFVPVLNTCKAYADDIEKCMRETFDKLEAVQKSDQEKHKEAAVPFTYCCVFKSSNNNQVTRDSILKLAGAYIQSKNRLNKVDFDKPDYVIFVHVICNMCFISFLSKFFDYRKYNLIEMGCKFSTNLTAKNAATTAKKIPAVDQAEEKDNEKDSENKAIESSSS